MLRAFNLGSWFYSERFDGAEDAVLSVDGSRLSWIDSDSVLHLRDLRDRTEKTWAVDTGNVRSSWDSGTMALTSRNDVVVWGGGTLTIWDANGKWQKAFHGRFFGAAECGGDTLVVRDYAPGPDPVDTPNQRLRIVDVTARSEKSVVIPTPAGGGRSDSGSVACTPHAETIVLINDAVVIAVSNDGELRAFEMPRLGSAFHAPCRLERWQDPQCGTASASGRHKLRASPSEWQK